MTCTQCKYEWCWQCDGKYTPQHFNQGNPTGCRMFPLGFVPPRYDDEVNNLLANGMANQQIERQIWQRRRIGL